MEDNNSNSDLSDPPGSSPSKHIFNLLLISIGFFALFSAFQTTQNLESSIVPDHILGYWSLASLYAVLCLCSLLFASPFVEIFHPKMSLVIGGLSYCLFIAANIFPKWLVMIPAAIVNGIGGAILWAAEGTYVTSAAANYAKAKNCQETSSMGLFNGIFFGIFQCTQISGNVLAGAILVSSSTSNGRSILYVFLTFLGCSIFGVLLFVLLRKETRPPVLHDATASKLLVATKLMLEKRMLLFIPCLFYNGLEQGFLFGSFNGQIIAKTQGEDMVCWTMAFFGACDALFSVVIGKVGDAFSQRFVVALGLFSQLIVYAGYAFLFFTDYLSINVLKEHSWILFLSVGLFALGDAVWNVFPNTMMSVFFTDRTEAAFSNLKLWSSLGFVVAFFIGPLIDFKWKVVAAAFGLILSCLCIILFDILVSRIDRKTNKYVQIAVNE